MIASCTSSTLRLVILSAAACNCCTAWAAGGAHEHGAAELLLSSEGRDVQIIFNAPAQSLVGFETAAVTEEQKAAVARAQAILMAPRDLFAVEGNSCELIDVTVDVSSLVDVGNAPSQAEAQDDHSDEHADHASHDEHTEEHADHDDHDEDHASTSDNHAHEHHDHDDDGDASDADSHSDVSASYNFECDSNKALTRIVFNRDGLPFGLERIDVLWVADWGQGAGQATPQSPSVNLQN